MDDTLKNLRVLAGQGNSFENPFDSKVPEPKAPKKDKRTKRKASFDDFIADSYKKLHNEDDYDDFDVLIDDLNEDDEDSDLRNALFSMGRKYARDYSASGETNEITKAFSPQAARLTDLLGAVTKDTAKLEEDIEEMRKMRSRNFGKISDLVEVKGALYNSQLQIIKELNSMTKTQFDIKNKMKEISGGDNSSAASQSIVQSIFGLGHDALLSGVGGRAGSSGAFMDSDDVDDADSSFETTEEYGELIASSTEDDSSDGSKFLKYEGIGAHYILEEDQEGHRRIYAEDQDGNVIDDYPIPKDVDELVFDINQKTNVAIDQLQRRYTYRSI